MDLRFINFIMQIGIAQIEMRELDMQLVHNLCIILEIAYMKGSLT